MFVLLFVRLFVCLFVCLYFGGLPHSDFSLLAQDVGIFLGRNNFHHLGHRYSGSGGDNMGDIEDLKHLACKWVVGEVA